VQPPEQSHIVEPMIACFLCIKENMPIDQERRKRMLGHSNRPNNSILPNPQLQFSFA
jgi:hypothetical protein